MRHTAEYQQYGALLSYTLSPFGPHCATSSPKKLCKLNIRNNTAVTQ